MCTANRVTPYPICLRLLLCGSGRAFRALHPVLWFFKLPIASISVHFRMQRSVTAASRAFISSLCAFSSDISNHKAKNTGFSRPVQKSQMQICVLFPLTELSLEWYPALLTHGPSNHRFGASFDSVFFIFEAEKMEAWWMAKLMGLRGVAHRDQQARGVPISTSAVRNRSRARLPPETTHPPPHPASFYETAVWGRFGREFHRANPPPPPIRPRSPPQRKAPFESGPNSRQNRGPHAEKWPNPAKSPKSVT